MASPTCFLGEIVGFRKSPMVTFSIFFSPPLTWKWSQRFLVRPTVKMRVCSVYSEMFIVYDNWAVASLRGDYVIADKPWFLKLKMFKFSATTTMPVHRFAFFMKFKVSIDEKRKSFFSRKNYANPITDNTISIEH